MSETNKKNRLEINNKPSRKWRLSAYFERTVVLGLAAVPVVEDHGLYFELARSLHHIHEYGLDLHLQAVHLLDSHAVAIRAVENWAQRVKW